MDLIFPLATERASGPNTVVMTDVPPGASVFGSAPRMIGGGIAGWTSIDAPSTFRLLSRPARDVRLENIKLAGYQQLVL